MGKVLSIVLTIMIAMVSCTEENTKLPLTGIWENTQVKQEYLVFGSNGDYVYCQQNENNTSVKSYGNYIFSFGKITFIENNTNALQYPAYVKKDTLVINHVEPIWYKRVVGVTNLNWDL